MADRGRKAFPFSSPVIFEYDIKRHYATHRERVKHMVPAVDNTPPEDFGHFQYNAKRAMVQAERLFEIDRENRILLEKMEKYNSYKSSDHFRSWSCRTGLNFKGGMVFNSGTNSLQIDHLNIPVNKSTTSGGRTNYKRQQELQHLARENLKILKAIESRKPHYSAQAWEHEHLETCSRIARLGTFRGPKSAQHLPTEVNRSLELAKSMRSSKWLPGTSGYQNDLAQTMRRTNTMRSGSIRVRDSVDRTSEESYGFTTHTRVDSATSRSAGFARPDAYRKESDAAQQRGRALSQAQSMRRAMSSREPRAVTASASFRRAESRNSRRDGSDSSSSRLPNPDFRDMFAGGESSDQIVMRVDDIPSCQNLFPSAGEDAKASTSSSRPQSAGSGRHEKSAAEPAEAGSQAHPDFAMAAPDEVPTVLMAEVSQPEISEDGNATPEEAPRDATSAAGSDTIASSDSAT